MVASAAGPYVMIDLMWVLYSVRRHFVGIAQFCPLKPPSVSASGIALRLMFRTCSANLKRWSKVIPKNFAEVSISSWELP